MLSLRKDHSSYGRSLLNWYPGAVFEAVSCWVTVTALDLQLRFIRAEQAERRATSLYLNAFIKNSAIALFNSLILETIEHNLSIFLCPESCTCNQINGLESTYRIRLVTNM